MKVLAVDLGGSHVSCAIVEDRTVIAHDSICTDAQSLRALLPSITLMLHRLLLDANVDANSLAGLGLGYCGIVDGRRGEVLSTLNKYPDIGEIDLAAWSQDQFGAPLKLESDVGLALLGERWAGAAQGFDDVVMITLGTGIGGAAMLGGDLLRSEMGQAGCIGGHLPVNYQGRLCACGAIGCAEAEASTSVLPTICREWPRFESSLLAKKEVLDFVSVFSAKDAGDSVAIQIVEHCISVWASLTVGLIHAYGPQLVLFGGGVMGRSEEILNPIQHYVAKHIWRTTRGIPAIQKAILGSHAAFLGAEALFIKTDR